VFEFTSPPATDWIIDKLQEFCQNKLGLFMVEMYSLPSSIMHGYVMIFYYQFFFTINKKLPLALEFNLYTYPLFE
jgi:hypothetical protein